MFVRNASNLKQLLPKASNFMNRNKNFKKVLGLLGAIKEDVLGTYSGYTAITIDITQWQLQKS
jgi:hypothetical protein